MNLLKMRMKNGDVRLMKYEPYIYKLNLLKFDVDTLTDGIVQWTYTPYNAPTVTKEQDGLNIALKAGGSACQFNLMLNQFSISKKIAIEYDVSFDQIYDIYLGYAPISLTYRNDGRVGVWMYSPTAYHIYKGMIKQSGTWTWDSYTDYYPFTQPIHCKSTIDPDTKIGEFYMNGELICDCTMPSYTEVDFFTINNGGGNINVNIKLHSLKISYV